MHVDKTDYDHAFTFNSSDDFFEIKILKIRAHF